MIATTDRRMVLGLGLDSWNNLIVGLAALAGLFAVLAAIATYIAFQLQKAEAVAAKREFEQYKLTVEGRVADAKQEGIKAGQTATDAQTKTKDLDQRTLARWRQFDRGKFLSVLGDGPHGVVEIIYGEEDEESFALSLSLRAAIESAGWTVSGVTPIPTKELLKHLTVIPENILIVARSNIANDTNSVMELAMGRTVPVRTPYITMSAAILATLGGGVGGSDPLLSEGFLRLVIFPRSG
jgi:hypothetical protein